MKKNNFAQKKYIILVFILSFSLHAETTNHTFMWDLKKGKRLEIVRTANVEYLENGIRNLLYEERNIIDLTAYIQTPDKKGMRLQGTFKTYRRNKGEEIFKLDRQSRSDFIIQKNGRYIVPSQYFMPNIRHIPTFPDTALKPGASWHAESEELFDIFTERLTLILTPNYFFTEIQNIGGTNIASINFNMIINKNLFEAGIRGGNFPYVIYGFNSGTLFWNMNENIPVSQNEIFHTIFGYGREHGHITLEYRMLIDTIYNIYDIMTKEDVESKKNNLKKELEKENVEVEEVPEGLAVRLGEILFNIDSDILKKDSENTLEKVMDIIKKQYPDREIVIEGHTDSTGTEEYNENLSERRAKRVADHVKKYLGHDKLSYKGFGSSKPVDTNSSASGRSKNRRVDIIIKLR